MNPIKTPNPVEIIFTSPKNPNNNINQFNVITFETLSRLSFSVPNKVIPVVSTLLCLFPRNIKYTIKVVNMVGVVIAQSTYRLGVTLVTLLKLNTNQM